MCTMYIAHALHYNTYSVVHFLHDYLLRVLAKFLKLFHRSADILNLPHFTKNCLTKAGQVEKTNLTCTYSHFVWNTWLFIAFIISVTILLFIMLISHVVLRSPDYTNLSFSLNYTPASDGSAVLSRPITKTKWRTMSETTWLSSLSRQNPSRSVNR